MNSSQEVSDAMAAYLAARRAGVSLEEQSKLWLNAERKAELEMIEKAKQGAVSDSEA